MSSHTSGPWSVETKGSRHFIDGEDGLTVAYLDRRGVRDEKEIEANAHLIAAAPDLLTALVALVGEYDLGEVDLEPEDLAKLEAARAAIAKAEGRA